MLEKREAGGGRRSVRAAAKVTIAGFSSVLVTLLLPAAASAYPSVYVTNIGSADVSLFDAAPDGSLTSQVPPSVPAAAADGLAISPDQNSLYVSNSSGSTIHQFDINAGGTPVPKATPTVATGNFPGGIVISPDGTDAYVTNGGPNTVSQYDVGPGGSLVPKTPASVPVVTGPFGIAISPDGADVYVTSYGTPSGGDISQYDVAGDGALSPMTPATVAAGAFPTGIAITPDGDTLYSTENNSFFVRQYDIAANGTLSPKTPATVAAGTSATAIVVSPDGDSAYVTNQLTDEISQYDIAADGKLSPKTPATVAAGDNPFGITIDAAGENVYAVAYNDSQLLSFDVGAGGALTPSGTPLAVGSSARFVDVREDIVGPLATIDSGPEGTVASRDASFTFSVGEPGATLECALDGGAFAPCSSPAAFSGLSEGTHSFSARATDEWDNTGAAATRGWTIDLPNDPPPEQPPSNQFSFGSVELDKKKGSAVLNVNVPGPGSVGLAGTSKLRAFTTSAGEAGTAKLQIRAKGAAKRKLVARGSARVQASVTFRPNGGEPNTESTKVTLKRRR